MSYFGQAMNPISISVELCFRNVTLTSGGRNWRGSRVRLRGRNFLMRFQTITWRLLVMPMIWTLYRILLSNSVNNLSFTAGGRNWRGSHVRGRN